MRVAACWIRIGFPAYLHEPDNSKFLLAVIKECQIAGLHGGQEVSCLPAADAAKGEGTAVNDVGPGGSERGELDKPIPFIIFRNKISCNFHGAML